MTSEVKLSVVVPVYNRAAMVEKTLDSIAAQSFRPFHLIIIDNNSTDSSLDVVTRWAERHREPGLSIGIASQPIAGAAAARNRGLEMVTTPWVMFFDSDDLMHPGHLERVVDAIESHPQADIIGWDMLLRHIDGSTKKLRFKSSNLLAAHMFNSILATQRYAVKTDFINRAGGWNPQARVWNDFETGIRLILTGPRAVKIKGWIGGDIIEHEDSITGLSFSPKAGQWENTLQLCRQALIATGKKRHMRWIDARHAVLAGLYNNEGNPLGRRSLDNLCASTSNPLRRLSLKIIYHHLSHKRRGAALLCRALTYL